MAVAALAELPEPALLRIADFLSPEDTVQLVRTCSRLYYTLPDFLVMKGEDFEVKGPSYKKSVREGAPPQLYFDGPSLTSTVRRLSMSLVWKDQGWGNLKGEIYVMLMRPAAEGEEQNSNPRVVAERRRVFGIAKHREETARAEMTADPIVTSALPGDFYRFMRIIGGGGGHSLTVRKFKAVATLTQRRKYPLETA